jgi:hypothetical protein
MFAVNRFHKALLVLALVLGQWLTLAHSFQHAALDPADQQCQLCLHAQGLDSGAAPSLPNLVLLGIAQEAPVSLPAISSPGSAVRYCPIRAPPVLV